MNKPIVKIEPNSARGFDCVKMMRDIRNQLDDRFEVISCAEQKCLIEQLSKGKEKLSSK